MKSLSSGHMRGLFYAIEVNVILWLCVAGRIYSSAIDATTKHMTTVAFVASALLQHWAYYNLLRRAKSADAPKK